MEDIKKIKWILYNLKKNNIKNLLERPKSRINITGERISEFKDTIIQITLYEQQRENRLQRNEQNQRDLQIKRKHLTLASEE